MAKRRTKARDDEAAEAPKERNAGQPMESEKKHVVSDAPVVEDVAISAPVHCDGCARKLRRSLQRLDGVIEVTVDSRTNTVVMSGPGAVQNARDAVKIVERKTGKKAALLYPLLETIPLAAVKGAQTKNNDTGGDEGDEIAEMDTEMVIVLRINLHCDPCCEEIKRRILKIEGVKEAVPLLKLSQIMVKGIIEPATLVGFIHERTGRKAAIIRAEPLDLPPTTESPPTDAPPIEAEPKHGEDPSMNSGEKKDGRGKEMNEASQEVENREGRGDNNANEMVRTTEKPGDGHGVKGHGTHYDGEDPTKGGDCFVLENHKKDDNLQFSSPLQTGFVTVAPEMALNNFNPYYTYPPYPYAHLHHYYQCPPPYTYSDGPAMYGYPHCPPEAFNEENPNACTVA